MLQALRDIPSMAWIPLFLLWLGHPGAQGDAHRLGALLPGLPEPAPGILLIDPRPVEVGRVYGYRRLGLVWHVLLPATLPAYLVGLRGGLGLAWRFVVAAEESWARAAASAS